VYEALVGPNGEWLLPALAVAAAMAVAYAIAELAARLARIALTAVSGGDARSFTDPIVRKPIRITRAVVFIVVLAALVLPALEMGGVSVPVQVNRASLALWLFGSGLRILIVALLTYLLVRVIATVTTQLETQIRNEGGADVIERFKRARTLSRLIRNALTVLVTAVAALMILRELNVDIMPVLTGAGIVGLAVGFGAQTLVKDLISGFFLILENHIRVGDVAKINGTGGLVESINLRTVVLRDLEGVVHVFPNGSIDTLSNLTKDFAYYVVDVGVAYKEDTDAVVAVLREVGSELAEDPVHRGSVLDPLEVLGVDAFGDSQVTIKIRIKTLPLKQWDVGRELRRRIKKAFDARGIEIPFPHVSVYFGEASRPWQFEAVDIGRRSEGAGVPLEAGRQEGRP
jgi:small conductance mechanosensitive channel